MLTNYLIKELHDLGDAALHVRVAGHVAGGAVAAGISGIVAVAALAARKPEIEIKKC